MTHIVVEGDGPDVVLIHGVGLDHTMWDLVAPGLAQSHRVIRYDLLGHGASPDPPGPRHLDDFVDQLRSVISASRATQPAVVGLSIGALIVQRFGVDHPAAASKLVIANGVYDPDDAHLAGYANRLAGVERDGMAAMIEPALERWFTASWRTRHPQRAEAIRTLLQNNDTQSYLKAYRTFVGSHHLITGSLSQLTTPTMVVTGALDVGSTPAMTLAMAEEIPDGIAVVLDGLHHVPPVEDPERFLEAVGPFLVGGTDS